MASREAVGLDKPVMAGVGRTFEDSNRGQAGNGAQTGFSTGATRSTSEGKIDFEGHLSPEVLEVFGDYMNRHRVQRDGQLRASDNWQKGIPMYRYTKSLIRHTFEFWRMWRGREVINPDNGKPFIFRDVLSAIMFNVMGIIFEMLKVEGLLDRTHLNPLMRTSMESEDSLKTEVSKKAYSDSHISPGGATTLVPGVAGQQLVIKNVVATGINLGVIAPEPDREYPNKEVNAFRAGSANPITEERGLSPDDRYMS